MTLCLYSVTISPASIHFLFLTFLLLLKEAQYPSTTVILSLPEEKLRYSKNA